MTGRGHAGVTVFFSLLLTILLAVICTSLESARYSLLLYFTSQAQGAVLESVYAGYYRPLWENYHLLFMADGAGLLTAMKEELELAGQGRGPFCFLPGGSQVVEAVTALDNGAAAFLEQVCEDAAAHGAKELVEQITGQADVAKEADVLSDYMEGLSGYGERIGQIEESMEQVRAAGRSLREEAERIWEVLESGQEAPSVEPLRRMAERTAEICRDSGTELRFAELEEALREERSRLEEQRELLSGPSFDLLEQEVASLEEYAAPDGSRRSGAEEERQLVLGQAEALLAGLEEAGSDVLRERIRALSALPEATAEPPGQESVLLETAAVWEGAGILSLVLGPEAQVSSKTLKEGAGLPEAAGPDGLDLLEKGAAALYMTEHFGCYGQEREEKPLSYEAEYVLNGAGSDRENLEAAAVKLTALRSGMNLMYLLGDGEKRGQAEALAAALVGFTGVYPLVRLASGLILGAWALAEGLTDVKTLCLGGDVPFIKTGEDWKLSLAEAPGAFQGTGAAEPSGSGDSGWDYERYLMVLFLLGDGGRQCIRMMELMEQDLRQDDAGFFMENCLSYSVVETEFRAYPLFPGLPVFRLEEKSYQFYQRAAYGY